ncbi:hypothetical protein V6E02_01855 [Thiobacter sp. AK1]|uniref:Uncharacterized protein n=1 Tax=Thiobacter aerophilum TaxID=3121275 RepID=A0ABV0EBP4_9BURK
MVHRPDQGERKGTGLFDAEVDLRAGFIAYGQPDPRGSRRMDRLHVHRRV